MLDKPLATQLGEFVARLRFEDLPPNVVDKGKALINHSMTVGLACSNAARARSARAAVIEHEGLGKSQVGGGQGATLWAHGARVSRVGAVFANGVAIAVNQQCDSYHMLTHPGVLIIPAGIATAEGEGRSGAELLTAIIAGYEVQCRVARDFIPSTQARGYRSSPTYGILGSAAATAKLLRLDATQTMNAIALAASFAGSLIEDYEFHQIGTKVDASMKAQIAALQKRVEVIGEVGRECFAPRITFRLKDGRLVTGEYHGRELMWDFAKNARELRRFIPALPVDAKQYERLVAAIAALEHAPSVDELVRLTLVQCTQ